MSGHAHELLRHPIFAGSGFRDRNMPYHHDMLIGGSAATKRRRKAALEAQEAKRKADREAAAAATASASTGAAKIADAAETVWAEGEAAGEAAAKRKAEESARARSGAGGKGGTASIPAHMSQSELDRQIKEAKALADLRQYNEQQALAGGGKGKRKGARKGKGAGAQGSAGGGAPPAGAATRKPTAPKQWSKKKMEKLQGMMHFYLETFYDARKPDETENTVSLWNPTKYPDGSMLYAKDWRILLRMRQIMKQVITRFKHEPAQMKRLKQELGRIDAKYEQQKKIRNPYQAAMKGYAQAQNLLQPMYDADPHINEEGAYGRLGEEQKTKYDQLMQAFDKLLPDVQDRLTEKHPDDQYVRPRPQEATLEAVKEAGVADVVTDMKEATLPPNPQVEVQEVPEIQVDNSAAADSAGGGGAAADAETDVYDAENVEQLMHNQTDTRKEESIAREHQRALFTREEARFTAEKPSILQRLNMI